MAIVQRISALHKRHQWLDQMLLQEMKQLHPDESRVTQIKKSKLRVKDEIVSLEGVMHKLQYVTENEIDFRRVGTLH